MSEEPGEFQIVEEANRRQQSVADWVRSARRKKAAPYDLSKDEDLVWLWEPLTAHYVELNPLDLNPPSSEEEFLSVIDAVCAAFRQFIEQEAGWKSLWNDDGTEKHEDAAQNLFRGIAKHYCRANNISIDREVNLGRGPVDFKFSTGSNFVAHLEVKKLTSGGFWQGLEFQLPTYMSTDGTRNGWFMAVQLRDGGVSATRKQQLPTEVDRVAKEQGLRLSYLIVDGRAKKSASKLR